MTTERNASADDQPQQRAFYNKPASCKSGLKKENYVSMNEAPNHCALSIWFKVLLKYLELIIYFFYCVPIMFQILIFYVPGL